MALESRFFSELSESLVPSEPVREIFNTMKRSRKGM